MTLGGLAAIQSWSPSILAEGYPLAIHFCLDSWVFDRTTSNFEVFFYGQVASKPVEEENCSSHLSALWHLSFQLKKAKHSLDCSLIHLHYAWMAKLADQIYGYYSYSSTDLTGQETRYYSWPAMSIATPWNFLPGEYLLLGAGSFRWDFVLRFTSVRLVKISSLRLWRMCKWGIFSYW